MAIRTPETIIIAINFADDTVGVMQFVVNDFATVKQEPTPAVIDAEIARSAFGEGKKPVKSWKIIEPQDVPADRTYRNAWTWRGKIEHDMPKARELHRDRLRTARAPLLAALDIDYQRADEDGDNAKKKQIAAKKKALRDVTDHLGIEAATTTEQLKAVWPDVLKG